MAQFIMVYVNGKPPQSPPSPEGQKAGKEKWQAWMQGLGAAIISPGNPMMGNQTVSSTGATKTEQEGLITGYSIVEAADMDAALAMAKDCPFLEMGDLQVAELMQMPGG